MKHYIPAMILAFCLISCDRHSVYRDTLAQVETFIEERPDSALSILQQISPDELSGKAEKARHALLLSMALDKNFVDIQSDSIIAPAVEYYRRHGTSKDKLLAHYYNGVVARNAGDKEKAMKEYIKAERYANKCGNYGIVGRLYSAKMDIYQHSYNFASAIEQEQLAAQYFLKDKDTSLYLIAINDIAVLYSQLGNLDKAKEYLEIIEPHLPRLDNVQKSYYYANRLNAALYDSTARVDHILKDYMSNISDSTTILWHGVANAHIYMEDFPSAIKDLDNYLDYGGVCDASYYYILATAYDGLGNIEEALNALKSYIKITGVENVEILESEARFVEERYAAEMQSAKQMFYIIIITLSLIIIALIVFVLSHIKKMKRTKEMEDLKHEMECKIIAKDKEKAEAQCQSLKAEKAETEKMFNSLKSEMASLKKNKKRRYYQQGNYRMYRAAAKCT